MGVGIAPLIPNLGSRWSSVFHFTPRPLHPQERVPYLLNGRLGGLQIRLSLYDMIYLLNAVGLTPGGSSTVHI